MRHACQWNRFAALILMGLFCAAPLWPVHAADAPAHEAPMASSPVLHDGVLRATLANGLKVVIVRNPLAPVVTTSVNYLVGSVQSPAGLPGTAHALEHMMFRGSPGLSAQQLSNIGSMMGGHYNANTREHLTQYYYTVPAEDLDVALHVEAARMKAINASPDDWKKERGAIEQEVSRDMSSPDYKVYEEVRARLFAGTPYAHTALGTRESFDKTDAAVLQKFHDEWYAPNNAILLVVGDVEPRAALKKIEAIFGALPAKPLPVRPAIALQPVTPASFTVESDQPYTLVYLAMRVPGLHDADYPALSLLADVMQSHRFALYDMVASGKALATFYEYMPLSQAGLALIGAAVPAGTDPKAVEAEIRAVLAKTVKDGVPADLVAAAKLQEKRGAAQRSNSIEDMASDWADAVALDGLPSPDEDLVRLEKVSPTDVNRVAAAHLDVSKAISVVLVPKPGTKPSSGGAGAGGETIALGESGPVSLPHWAAKAMTRLDVPKLNLQPHVSTLPNGLTLIVQPVASSKTVALYGVVRHNSALQEPKGKDGVTMLSGALMSYGTDSLDRLAFQREVDQIGASVHAGLGFSARAMPKDFDRAVALLADNQLHPAFPDSVIKALEPQYAQFVESSRQSPDYLTSRTLNMALYPKDDPSLRETTGATLSALERQDLVNYYRAVMRPDMTAIVVIGDITPVKARSIVEKYFGGWRAEGPKPVVDLPAVPDNHASSFTVPNPSRVQNDVTLAQTLSLQRTNPDYYALQLGNAVLGGGIFSARLYNDLRVNTGLVYTVSSYLSAARNRASYVVHYGSDPDNVGKANAIVIRDIKAMQDTPVPDDTLRTAKAYILRQLPLDQASLDGIADGYLSRFNLGLPYNEPDHAADRIAALTPAEVQTAFKKWLRPDDLVRASQGPAQ